MMGKNQTNAAVAGNTNTPTPENTPIPGGGSWRWDIALPGWVERDVNTGEDLAATDTPV
ncbi:hypothetical protein [Rhodoferax aquaticus]|uniref:hypothetical protein n=1 Tax=Rhodoferax aquaticus TaxID=2527691 RepID=UPI00143E0C87|nr:hypothetical protein [Rhodoferax aquaticus]